MSPKACRGGHKDRVRLGDAQRPWVTIAVFDLPTAEDRFERLREMSRLLVDSGKASEAPRLVSDAALVAGDAAAFRGVERFVIDLCRTPGAVDGPVTFRELCRRYTTGELHARYPKYVDKKGKAESTRKKEAARLALLCKTLGDMPVASITLEDADRAMLLLPDGSGSSWRRSHEQPLFHVMKLACFPMKLISASPIPSAWVSPPSEQRETPILYPDEDALLMASSECNPLDARLYWGIQAREAFRPGGAAMLRWDDFDLERGTVQHRHKTKRSRMWVLDPSVWRALVLYKALLPPDEEFVFPRHARSTSLVVNAAPDLRAGLLRAGVNRKALHVLATGDRRPLEAHGLRASCVTLALANGQTEHWVMDRTGHTTSDQIALYKKLARSVEAMDLGWYGPLDVLTGLAPTAAATHRKPTRRDVYLRGRKNPTPFPPAFPQKRVGQLMKDGASRVGQRVGQIRGNTEQNASFKTTCYALKASPERVEAVILPATVAPGRTKAHGNLTQAPEGGPGFREGGSGALTADDLDELLAIATRKRNWPLVRRLTAQLEGSEQVASVSSLDAARKRKGRKGTQ